MKEKIQDPHQKALTVNLDNSKYGTIAEIGAGQETARWFFRAGGAAGTIAKTISAYDMKYSDAIYGASPRYVSKERLHAMLDHEYDQLIERLSSSRGKETMFFAFANTVAARSYTNRTDGHGWLGIRFQHEPQAAPSQIDVHVNLHGKNNVQDQETLGILGVNLIYGALNYYQDILEILPSLMDSLYPELLEVDMLECRGPGFDKVDNRLIALELVQHGLSNAAMFTADGHVAQVADTLWKKSVLVERSRFHPPTKLTMNLLDSACTAYIKDTGVNPDSVFVISEMTLKNLSSDNDANIDVQDFLNRADILCALGKNVLISNYGEYYRLAQYLFRYTSNPIAIAMGLPTLREIFNEKHYEELPGGILESFGRLFKHDLRLYVCPELDTKTNQTVTVESMQVALHLQHLYAYLLENGFVKSLNTVKDEYLKIHSDKVLEQIQAGDNKWENLVPNKVVNIIKEKGLFNWNQ
ncbi:MAG: hypothetical protein R3354_00560 [Thiohalomonadales bacterium]|nr:hypothetical protein [Thiohalomonadales bacterium]